MPFYPFRTCCICNRDVDEWTMLDCKTFICFDCEELFEEEKGDERK